MEVSGQPQDLAALPPRKEALKSLTSRLLAPKYLWTFWKKKKLLAPDRILPPDLSAL